MKNLLLSIVLLSAFQFSSFAQMPAAQIEGKEVYKGEDVVFHQIDEHTWIGSGHLMASESLYLVEGTNKAVLIDAGTKIADLDKIVASITKKPVMLVATHVHPDHVGSIDNFPEIYINPADTVNIPQFMPNYKGKVKFLKNGEMIDLGGRKLEVVFTPAHTPGSTTFIDKAAGYGFSGDSFGSGNLLLGVSFSTLISTCENTSAIMGKYGIKYLYPGHFFGKNLETKERVDNEIIISKGVLSGQLKGEDNPRGMMGLNLVINQYGVRINYNSGSIK
jgi:glyoxylase-like metal-dependent hydrolase (beta-lactamase superfamily II)